MPTLLKADDPSYLAGFSRGVADAAPGGASFERQPSSSVRKLTFLYDFKGTPSDHANPDASLLNVDGTLYGTTTQGGSDGFGAIFSA